MSHSKNHKPEVEELDFSHPLFMGIINVTPDSFSDGGHFLTPLAAAARIRKLIDEGADIIDIGAESTFGPNAQVSEEEEIFRLKPVLESIEQFIGDPSVASRHAKHSKGLVSGARICSRSSPRHLPLHLRSLTTVHSGYGAQVSGESIQGKMSSGTSPEGTSETLQKKVLFSVDTWKSQVAEFSLSKGVHMINDVTGLRGDPNMVDLLCRNVGTRMNKMREDERDDGWSDMVPYVCVMYSSHSTPYAQKVKVTWPRDVISTIKNFLKRQTDLLIGRGFPRAKIIIDPGMGMFLSSDPSVSFEVVNRLAELSELGFPILVGHSMKSFLGGQVEDRQQRSFEVGKTLIENGANILRIHEVGEQRRIIE